MALLVKDVYELLLDSIRSDKRGDAESIDEFNRLIRKVNQEIYDDYISFFEENTINSDTLAGFKVHDYEIALTEQASRRLAYGSMPSNYYQVIGKPWVLDSDSIARYVDEVTEFEDGVREADYLTKATVVYPTCRIGGVNELNEIQIKVRPQTITSVYVSFFKDITVPFLDYYMSDTTYNVFFLDETSTLQTIPVGYTYRTGTPGTGTATTASQTVNLEWGEGDLSLIMSKLLQAIGSSLPDEGIQKTGIAEEIKTQE
jgi:hypothetical protein